MDVNTKKEEKEQIMMKRRIDKTREEIELVWVRGGR